MHEAEHDYNALDNYDTLIEAYWDAETPEEEYQALTHALTAAQNARALRDEAFCRLKLAQLEFFHTGKRNQFVSHFLWCFRNITDEMLEESLSDDGEIYYDFFWNAKYITNMADYASISKDTLRQLVTFVQTLYEKFGQDLRPIYGILLYYDTLGLDLDLGEDMEQVFDKWLHSRNEEFDDCPACLRDFEIRWYLRRNQVDKAVTLSQSYQKDRYLKCQESPSLTYAQMLPPLLETGDTSLADTYAQKCYTLCQNHPALTEGVMKSLAYQSVKHPEKALEKYKDHIHLFEKTETDYDRLDFYFCSFVLFAHLATRENTPQAPHKVNLMFSERMPFFSQDSLYHTEELKEYFQEQYRSLAALFDKRNGNTYISDKLNKIRSLYGLDPSTNNQ